MTLTMAAVGDLESEVQSFVRVVLHCAELASFSPTRFDECG